MVKKKPTERENRREAAPAPRWLLRGRVSHSAFGTAHSISLYGILMRSPRAIGRRDDANTCHDRSAARAEKEVNSPIQPLRSSGSSCLGYARRLRRRASPV